jgi:uncharacterized protein YgiM (DUF1202 family)
MKKTTRFLLLLCSIMLLACSLTSAPLEIKAENTFVPTSSTPTPKATEVFQTTPSPTSSTCVVSAQTLHLRSCAGLECAVKDWLNEGTRLTILVSKNGWYQVTTPAGENGWVNSKYCGGKQ